ERPAYLLPRLPERPQIRIRVTDPLGINASRFGLAFRLPGAIGHECEEVADRACVGRIAQQLEDIGTDVRLDCRGHGDMVFLHEIKEPLDGHAPTQGIIDMPEWL